MLIYSQVKKRKGVRGMELTIRCEAKEIAALVLELQGRQEEHTGKNYVKDFSEGDSNWDV